jgi:hypothetical protein
LFVLRDRGFLKRLAKQKNTSGKMVGGQAPAYIRAPPFPVSNRRLDALWHQKNLNLHRSRVKTIKTAIDNRPPQTFTHLKQKLKKVQLEDERYMAIERANFLLLDKMSHIMTGSSKVGSEQTQRLPQIHTLNWPQRKRERERVTMENEHLLRRLQGVRPVLSRREWSKEEEMHQKYLANASEPLFPIDGTTSLFGPPSPPKGSRRNRSRGGSQTNREVKGNGRSAQSRRLAAMGATPRGASGTQPGRLGHGGRGRDGQQGHNGDNVTMKAAATETQSVADEPIEIIQPALHDMPEPTPASEPEPSILPLP